MRTIELQPLLDESRLSARHIATLVLCALIMFIDGFDVYMLGKIAPAVAAGFNEAPEAMTQVFLMQQVGLTVGAFLFGPVADRYGRKTVLLLCLVGFGLFTLAALAAADLTQLAITRGLAGIFLSGVVPNASALITEMSPRKHRSTFLSIIFTGYSASGIGGAMVAAFLLDRYGWQSGFWIGAILPLAFLPLFAWLLPESLPFLARRNGSDPRIARTLRWISPGTDIPPDARFVLPSTPGQQRGSIAELFSDGRLMATMLLWAACFLSMANITLLGSWLPTFFQELGGIPIQTFAIVSTVTFVGNFVGTLAVGVLLDRFRGNLVLALMFLGHAVALIGIGNIAFGTIAFAVALAFTGFFQSAGQAGLNAIVARIYPSSSRSTGFGWAGGIGRIGGIISPALGGLAIASHLSLQQTFFYIALPPIILAVLVMLLQRAQRQPAAVPAMAA